MAAQIVIVERGRVLGMTAVERLWFFPDGSEYLRYSPHFHVIHIGGLRTNFPLCYGFVVVLDGKLSVKDYLGKTITKIEVRDQVWYHRVSVSRGSPTPAKGVYAELLHVEPYYVLPKPIHG